MKLATLSLLSTLLLGCLCSGLAQPTWLPNDVSEYLLSSDALSWEQARDACVAMNASIATVSSAAEQRFLATEVQGTAHWVGLRSEGAVNHSCSHGDAAGDVTDCVNATSADYQNACCKARRAWGWADNNASSVEYIGGWAAGQPAGSVQCGTIAGNGIEGTANSTEGATTPASTTANNTQAAAVSTQGSSTTEATTTPVSNTVASAAEGWVAAACELRMRYICERPLVELPSTRRPWTPRPYFYDPTHVEYRVPAGLVISLHAIAIETAIAMLTVLVPAAVVAAGLFCCHRANLRAHLSAPSREAYVVTGAVHYQGGGVRSMESGDVHQHRAGATGNRLAGVHNGAKNDNHVDLGVTDVRYSNQNNEAKAGVWMKRERDSEF